MILIVRKIVRNFVLYYIFRSFVQLVNKLLLLIIKFITILYAIYSLFSLKQVIWVNFISENTWINFNV